MQTGRAKLTVVSREGKEEATVTLLAAEDFVGEESLSTPDEIHKATASAITACVTMKIDRLGMLRALDADHGLADLFLKFMLARSMRTRTISSISSSTPARESVMQIRHWRIV